MTQTSTPARYIVKIAAADLRHGDIVVNEDGERLYAAFDLTRRPEYVAVYTAEADMENGQPRRIDLNPETVLLVSLEAGSEPRPSEAPVETPAPSLSTSPWEVAEIVARRAVHVIDAFAVAPGVVRLTVTPGRHVIAANYLLQAGYDVTHDGVQTVTAVPGEPDNDEDTADRQARGETAAALD